MPTDANVTTQDQKTDGQSQVKDGQKPADQKQTDQQQQHQTTQPGVKQEPTPGSKGGVDDQQQRGLIADLQKERQARQKLEQQITALNAGLEAERKRVQALAGVTPKSDEEVEIEQVRDRLVKMFPILGRLDDETMDELLGLRERAGSIEEATEHHWRSHGRTTLDSLTSAVAEEVGRDLTERQTKALHREFVTFVENDPEALKRYEAGDPKLVEEFAKTFIEDWFETARKAVVTQEVGRQRRVPSGRDRNVQITPPKKIDFKDEKAVSDAMVESFKAHGGRFEN